MSTALTSGSVVAGFRISRLIGKGAAGAVYLAEGADGRQVALKVPIPELAHDERFRQRFLREAQIAAALDEPHVVPTRGLRRGRRDALPGDGLRGRPRPARDPAAGGAARSGARRGPHRSGRRRPRRRARPRPRPPRREAGQRARGRRPRPASTPTCATSASPSTSPRSRASPAIGTSSAPSPTSPPSRSRGGRSTRGRTSTRWAACSSSASPVRRRSAARASWRPSTPT